METRGTEAEQFEKIKTLICKQADDVCVTLANEIAELIREKNKAGKSAVLGLATGSTPVRLYRQLIRLHKEEGLSFKNVITFNLDEYQGLERGHPESYWKFMQEQLFLHIDILEENIYLPDGTIDRQEAYAYCQGYEDKIREAGGIDMQILGIGRTGHIGFNEPGSTVHSRTRMVTLDSLTRRDAARDFLGEENVPRHAITIGVATILEARKVVLLAWGESKAVMIRKAVEGEQSESITASFLQRHDDVRFMLDEPAASELTRTKHPWRVGQVKWTSRLARKAVVWLAHKVGKPVLKLLDEEYNEHRLSDLITEQGPAYNLNIRVFNEIQHTITGWPGGKPNADDTSRPERREPEHKRVLIFSPEPQDAELALGGTLHRLIDQMHDVSIAYLTSGNLAVPDGEALLAAELVLELSEMDGESGNGDHLAQTAYKQLQKKELYDADTQEIRKLKGLIRRGEARAACKTCLLDESHIRFLDLPFYENGRYRQFKQSEEDIAVVVELLKEIKPHQIFATGSVADPSSIAATSYTALLGAIDQIKNDQWFKECRVWLYPENNRAWPTHDIDMAVPLSPKELTNKLQAVYKHQSQRSQTVSGKEDPWQQVEKLNSNTAKVYDDLGLAEYEAIETFKRWNG